MSVINNVLKNLESRETRFTPVEINSFAPEAAPARDLKPVLLITVLLVLMALAAWLYLREQPALVDFLPEAARTSSAPVTPQPVAPAVVEPAAVESAAGTVTEPVLANQIIGLQIRESEADMQLEFALREKVVAYLKERGENSFGYHLRDIDSQIVAPLISNNQWIRELSIVAVESGVDINFQTSADILVETRQDQLDGESVWVIKLRKSVVPVESQPVVEVARNRETVVNESPRAAVPATAVPAPAPVEVAAAEESAPPVEIDIKSTNPNTVSINQLEYAVQLINSRRIVEAEKLLQSLLDGAEDLSARQHLLALYAGQKMIDREQRLLRESMARYPQNALFKTEYGRSLFQRADYRSVIQFFDNEIDLGANQQALVAASYQRLDEHGQAVDHYQLALAQDANNPRNWIGLGISQEHTAALEAALDSYQKAARLGGLNSRLRAFVDTRSQALRQVLN